MYRFKRTMVLVLAILILAGATARAAAPEWKWVGSLPQTNDLFDVTYGNGEFVAVGASGTIITSADGLHWTLHESGTARSLKSVLAGPNLFVATGSQDEVSGLILTSPDGATWTSRFTSETGPVMSVAYGSGRYVAVGWSIEKSGGLDGMILISPDGQDWRPVTSPVQGRLVDIIHADGRFLATDGNHMLTSSDGETWEVHTLPDDQSIYQVVRTSNGYLGVGTRSGFGAVYRSDNGETWAPVEVAKPDGSAGFPRVAHTGQRYVILGTTSRNTGYIFSSADTSQWQVAYSSDLPLHGVACGAGTCVAVGSLGTILQSAMGTEWKPLSNQPQRAGSNIVYGAGRFVIVGRDTVSVSTNGVDWTQVPIDTSSYLGQTIYTGSQFVTIRCAIRCNMLSTSADGVTWESKLEYRGLSSFAGLAYGNGRYVVMLGNAVGVISSEDLVTWTGSDLRLPLSAVAFGQEKFVGSTYEGAILTSADGIFWREVSRPAEAPLLYQIAYGDGRFVAVGASGNPMTTGVILTSLDGETWTPSISEPGTRIEHVAYGDSLFVAWGPSVILTSANGVNWTSTRNRAGYGLSSIAYGAGRFVGASGAETVMIADRCGSVFPDLPAGTAACKAAEDLAARGVIAGFPDGTFKPERILTRAELTKMLVLALGKSPAPDLTVPFSDTASHWVYSQGFLQTAVTLNAISGFPDGSFQPDGPVTRAQVAKIVAAAAGLVPSGKGPYQDIRGNEWFAGWVAAAHQASLIGPQAKDPLWMEGSFRGDQPVTRAEAAMLLSNLVNAKAPPGRDPHYLPTPKANVPVRMDNSTEPSHFPAAPMTMAGIHYAKGVQFPVSHGSEAQLEWDLGGTFHSLTGVIGIEDGTSDASAIDFVILGDDKELGRFTVANDSPVKALSLSLEGVKTLAMRAASRSGAALVDAAEMTLK